ncbi:ABH_G0027280.mRNA.1.CDS.1 [Saccharomyces cerevisiae]|nr:ABH_G0027280.mRNA.1.CDS.1 [Saccharomyces cerevisiae]CAI6593966.1 ABH_G0027280.mRNA.1.CDS.1 [Saccharomyces cerevisiae]
MAGFNLLEYHGTPVIILVTWSGAIPVNMVVKSTVVENGFSNFDWVGFRWVGGLEHVVLGQVSSDIRDVDTQFNQVDSFRQIELEWWLRKQ